MSFKENHMINLGNYEEWFILYMDNELSAGQKEMVDHFLLLHPYLQQDLDMLMGTKLPAEDLLFTDKENLQASAMKLNMVDEALLLLIDNELPAAEKKATEERIETDTDFRLQHSLLLQTKMDAAEIISYPNKKELYRHTEKVYPLFPVWMRIAVAVMLILFASFFFLYNAENNQVAPVYDTAVKMEKVPGPNKTPLPVNNRPETALPTQQQIFTAKAGVPVKAPAAKQAVVAKFVKPGRQNPALLEEAVAQVAVETANIGRSESLQLDMAAVNSQPVTALNNSMANLPVTSLATASYNPLDSPGEPIVTDGDDKPKRTPAKGFLRKVSRFIERRTGIGTVNADNELLIGAVALKLN